MTEFEGQLGSLPDMGDLGGWNQIGGEAGAPVWGADPGVDAEEGGDQLAAGDQEVHLDAAGNPTDSPADTDTPDFSLTDGSWPAEPDQAASDTAAAADAGTATATADDAADAAGDASWDQDQSGDGAQ